MKYKIFENQIIQPVLQEVAIIEIQYENENLDNDMVTNSESPVILSISNVTKESSKTTTICDICGKQFTNNYTLKFHKDTVHLQMKNFSCELCQKSFSTKYKLKRHQTAVHCEKRSETCPKCLSIFKTRDILVKHMRIHETELGPFLCTLCYQEFKFRSGLDYHTKIKHTTEKKVKRSRNPVKDKEKYTCEICGKVFHQKNNYQKHCFIHGDKTIQCLQENCPKKFKSIYDRNKHMKIHQQVYFQCNFCSKHFKDKLCYDVHTLKHTSNLVLEDQNKSSEPEEDPVNTEVHEQISPTIFCCDKCDKNLSSKSILLKHLKKHIRIANSVKPTKKHVMCHLCSNLFVSNNCLLKHIKRVHEKDKKSCICDICNKSFAVLFDLKRHMIKHTIDRNYECDICKQKFKCNATLTQHKKLLHTSNSLRTNEKKFHCKICDRKYFYERHLQFHLRKHKEDKRYECPRENCQQKFFYSDAVKWHLIRFHMEEAPYKCLECNKKFIHEKPHTNHLKGHREGGLSTVCTICGKIISEAKNYQRHLRTHGVKSFKCWVCNAAFRERFQLKKHMLHDHGEKQY